MKEVLAMHLWYNISREVVQYVLDAIRGRLLPLSQDQLLAGGGLFRLLNK